MTQKSILITGCSSGIGYAAAHGLRERGWQVFAACRKASDCERLTAEGFASPRIDYEDPDSILNGLADVLETAGGRLDALFNNGAYAIPGPVEDLPTDGLRAIFEANFFGWHELTRHTIPVMRAQGSGRIVQCSSVLGLVSMPWRGAYNATKFALEALTDAMRIEMADTNIQISLIEPGPIRTPFRNNAVLQFERWIDWENSARVQQYRDGLLEQLYRGSSSNTFELEPEAVVKKLIHALEHRRPRAHYYVTTPTYLMAGLRRLLPARALDRIVARA